jgi:nucleotide-binding universal stress UspA family protein
MKRILVTTDFSANSLSGLRLAAQLAVQINAELHVLHVYFIPGTPGATQAEIAAKEEVERNKLTTALSVFSSKILRRKHLPDSRVKYAVIHGFIAEAGIREYAESNKIDLICIATRGAGQLKKIMGTTAGNLIQHAGIPVIAVPIGYRSRAMKKIYYASDMAQFHREMVRVAEIADLLHADIEVVHFHEPNDLVPDKKAVQAKALKEFNKVIKVHYVPMVNKQSLVVNMSEFFTRKKPPLVIMFTRHHRNFLEKLIDSSKTEGFVFRSSVPLMAFHKIS